MRTSTAIFVAACAAMTLTACASAGPDLTTARAPSKRDAAQCDNAAGQVVDNPERRNNQTAAAVGTTIGAGLVGLIVVSAVQASDDKAVASKVRNECLSRKGYKLVPVKTKD